PLIQFVLSRAKYWWRRNANMDLFAAKVSHANQAGISTSSMRFPADDNWNNIGFIETSDYVTFRLVRASVWFPAGNLGASFCLCAGVAARKRAVHWSEHESGQVLQFRLRIL